MGIKVIDKDSQQEIEVDSLEATKGIREGRYVSPSARVRIVRDDGELGTIDVGDTLLHAIDSGFRLVDDEETAQIKLRREAGSAGNVAIGTAEALASGATLGLSTALEEGLGVDPAGMSARREELGTLGTASTIAGAVLPSLFTGGAGAGASAGRLGAVARATPAGALSRAGARLGESVAGTTGAARVVVPTVQGAVEGFGAGVGTEVDESVLGERELAAERLFMRGGAGALLGGLGGSAVGGLGAVGAGLGRVTLGSARRVLGAADNVGGEAGPSIIARVATDDNFRTYAHALGLDEDASLLLAREIREGNGELARYLDDPTGVTEELAAGARPAFERVKAAHGSMRRATGGESKLRNTERTLPQDADSLARIPDAAAKHIAEQRALIAKAMQSGGRHNDLERLAAMLDEAEVAIKEAAKGGSGKWTQADQRRMAAVAVRQLDRFKQGAQQLQRNNRRIASSFAPTREAQNTTALLDEMLPKSRAWLEDETLLGAAGASQKEVNAAWRQYLELEEQITGARGQNAMARLLDPDSLTDNADLLTAVRSFGGFKGETKTELLTQAIAAQRRLGSAIKKHYEIDDAVRSTIDDLDAAADDLSKTIEGQRAKVRTLDAAEKWRIAEGNRSVSIGIGSNMATAALGAAGFGLGGVPGAIVGGALGTLARPYTMLRKLAHIQARLGSAGGKQAAAVAGFVRQVAGKALRAGGLLGSAAKKTAPQMIRLRKERNEKAKQRAADLVNNPQMLADELRRATMDMEDVAPRLAKAYADKATQAAIYLAKHTPPSYQAPLSHRKPLVDPIAQAEFERRVETVMDPLGALERLENGTFTREHAETIRAVYPALFRDMQRQVMDAVADAYAHKREIPLATATQLSVLFDLPIDPTLGSAASIARAFGPPPSAAPAQPQAPNKDFKIDTDRYKTPMQSLGMIRMEA